MLKLIYAPDPILKKDSVSLPQVDEHHRELIKQMYEIMYSANGVGLAAPQIGLNIRIFILDASSRDEEKKPITMINPKIISLDENKVPEQISWSAKDGGISNMQSKAILLSFWDSKKQETLKMDLWVKDMPIDQMKLFFHQPVLGSQPLLAL